MTEYTRADGLALLDTLLDGARLNLALHPDHFLPTLFISTAGKVEIVGLGGGMPEGRSGRHTALMAVGRTYARDAEWVAYIADAWVKRNHRGPLPPRIEGDPEAVEALVSMWLARDGQWAAKQMRYTRVPSDGRSAERVVFHEPETMDMASLYDYDSVCATVLRGGGWKSMQQR